MFLLVAASGAIAQAASRGRAATFAISASNSPQESPDPDTQKRRDKAEALADLHPPPSDSIPTLIKGLHDADQLVRTYSGHALVNTGPPAIAALAPIVKNPHFDADVAWSQQVILVLGQMARREPDAQLLLISTFRSERQPFAASQLGQAGAPAVPALRRALKDDDARIRAGAAWTLRIMGPPAKDAITDLSAAVKDPVLRVREEAAMALANIDPHGEQHVPILLEALKDNDIFCRIGAANALQKIGGGGEEAAPTLEHVLVSDPNGGVRRFTAQALGLIGTPDALKALTRAAAQDKDETVRSEAILAIARSGRDYPPATEMMVRSLGDKVDSVRHAASWGLANLGPPAIPLLTAALKDPSPDIQVSAARVLAEIQPLSGNAVNVLLIAMKDQSNSLQLQSAAADALEDAGGAPRRAALAELQLVPQQAAAWREYFLRGQ